jgi:transposase-like protein
MQAIDLVLDEGLTVYAAARQIGVNESAVHRAMDRRKDKEICPCCNQVIRQ